MPAPMLSVLVNDPAVRNVPGQVSPAESLAGQGLVQPERLQSLSRQAGSITAASLVLLRSLEKPPGSRPGGVRAGHRARR